MGSNCPRSDPLWSLRYPRDGQMSSLEGYRLRTLLIVLALGPPILAGICAWSLAMLRQHKIATFVQRLNEAEAKMAGLELDDVPMLSLPPSDALEEASYHRRLWSAELTQKASPDGK
jgi:hypothetical protein